MKILRICLDKQLLLKNYLNLILPKIHNMMDINMNLVQRFINFLIKSLCGGVVTRADKSANKNETITNQRFLD